MTVSSTRIVDKGLFGFVSNAKHELDTLQEKIISEHSKVYNYGCGVLALVSIAVCMSYFFVSFFVSIFFCVY